MANRSGRQLENDERADVSVEYIDFGKTGMRVSRFGLGCMRLPADEAEAVAIVRGAIDNGVNYLDTAYIYPGSEELVGKALTGGYRDRACLVTKCPVINVNKYEEMEKFLDEELRRLKTECIDVYMLHNLSPGVWSKVKKLDCFKFLEEMQKKGKILRKGFSIHNSFEAFKEAVDSYSWDMAQIQLNILDEKPQAGGTAGLKYAAFRGLPVTIMEPLRGGSLISDLSPEGRRLIEDFPVRRSLAEWAFRWLYNKPEVSVILSGVSTMEQLKDNLRIFENSAAGVMDAAEEELIVKLRATFETQKRIGCTDCKYCMPCPQTVLIPSVFAYYNKYMLTKDESLKEAYRAGSRKADKCVGCRLCEQHCPQGLQIAALLKEAHAVLEG